MAGLTYFAATAGALPNHDIDWNHCNLKRQNEEQASQVGHKKGTFVAQLYKVVLKLKFLVTQTEASIDCIGHIDWIESNHLKKVFKEDGSVGWYYHTKQA